jgi:hypothetical protein
MGTPAMRASTRRSWILAALWLGLATALVLLHGEVIDFGPRQAKIIERHTAILAHSGESPWAYRIAMPLLAETLRPAAERLLGLSVADAVCTIYAVLRGLALWSTFLLLHRWLSRRFAWPWPLAGTLLLAALCGPATVHYWFAPDSPVDLAVWAAALVLTDERRDPWLFLLIVAGAFNRETALFAVALHVALRWGHEPRKRLALRTVLLVVTWALVVASVHLAVGSRPWAHGGTPAAFLAANLAHPGWLAWAATFLGVLWIAPALSWHRLTADLRRALAALVPYLVLVLAFGRVREVRLLLPAALVMIPTLLVAIGAETREASPDPGP